MNEFQKTIEAGLTKKPKFDPNGSGYDEETFNAAGLKRGPDGHASSLNPNNGMLLKGRNHPTFGWTMNAEKSLGNVLVAGKDGRYYSRKEGELQEGEKPIEYTPEELAKAELAKQENNKQVFEKDFQSAVEAGLAKKPQSYNVERLTSYAGYPVIHAKDMGLMDYYAGEGKNVGGMAWGGKTNPEGQGKGEPSSIIPNPYMYKDNAVAHNALVKLEASRHWMDENNHKPSFKITPEMQQWRHANFDKTGPAGDAYRTNDDAFRKTIISRFIGGDSNVPPLTPDLDKEVQSVQKKLESANAAAPKPLISNAE